MMIMIKIITNVITRSVIEPHTWYLQLPHLRGAVRDMLSLAATFTLVDLFVTNISSHSGVSKESNYNNYVFNN